MSRAEFANLVGIVATAVTFVQILPQIMRLIRTGHTEGVSPVWAAGGATINLGWLTYVIEGRFWVTIPSIIVAMMSFVVALYLLYRNGADIRAGLVMSVAIVAASAVVQQVAGWTALGTVLGLSNGLYLGPSVVSAWRSHAPVGVSPLTWVLTVLEGLKWGFYGVLVEAVPIMVYGSTAILLALLVLLRLWVTRDRVRAALASPARMSSRRVS